MRLGKLCSMFLSLSINGPKSVRCFDCVSLVPLNHACETMNRARRNGKGRGVCVRFVLSKNVYNFKVPEE